MGIFSNYSANEDVVMTLGTFDGIHKGHKRIINLTVEKAKERGCSSSLFTFDNHPLQVISPESYPSLLTSWEQKKKLVKELGIDYVFRQEFTPEFARLTYHEFIEELIANFSLQEIIVGEDFRCGYQGKGTPSKLSYLGKEYGFKVRAVPAVKIAEKEVSSTLIRRLIREGEVKKVKNRLGRNFAIECNVVTGDKRGRKLGFPTANLEPVVDYVLPLMGVYACWINWKEKKYAGIVNLGLRPTFTNDRFSIEVHIFNFNQDLYGEKLELEFVERIREEKKFTSHDQLIAQINDDVKKAKDILNFS